MTDVADVDIAVCTFRRAHITDTLQSIGDITPPQGYSVRIIVVDNDDTPSAQDRVNACELPFPITYVHAPGRNISIARNACLETATAPRLVFIDDDELVTKDWLTALLSEQEKSGAEVVLGPMKALYPANVPEWMRASDHHSTVPVFVNGNIETGYGCNVLLMRSTPSFAGLRFREDLGRSGGEDTIFVASICLAGGKISYAPDALVTEAVLPQRATLRWLLNRKFRFGQTHGLMLQDKFGLSLQRRLVELMRAGGKCVVCFGMAVLTGPIVQKSTAWLLRGSLHAGVVSQFLGGRSSETYGTDQPT